MALSRKTRERRLGICLTTLARPLRMAGRGSARGNRRARAGPGARPRTNRDERADSGRDGARDISAIATAAGCCRRRSNHSANGTGNAVAAPSLIARTASSGTPAARQASATAAVSMSTARAPVSRASAALAATVSIGDSQVTSAPKKRCGFSPVSAWRAGAQFGRREIVGDHEVARPQTRRPILRRSRRRRAVRGLSAASNRRMPAAAAAGPTPRCTTRISSPAKPPPRGPQQPRGNRRFPAAGQR